MPHSHRGHLRQAAQAVNSSIASTVVPPPPSPTPVYLRISLCHVQLAVVLRRLRPSPSGFPRRGGLTFRWVITSLPSAERQMNESYGNSVTTLPGQLGGVEVLDPGLRHNLRQEAIEAEAVWQPDGGAGRAAQLLKHALAQRQRASQRFAAGDQRIELDPRAAGRFPAPIAGSSVLPPIQRRELVLDHLHAVRGSPHKAVLRVFLQQAHARWQWYARPCARRTSSGHIHTRSRCEWPIIFTLGCQTLAGEGGVNAFECRGPARWLHPSPRR